MSLITIALFTVVLQEDQWKPPMSKAEEKRKFHSEQLAATPAANLEASYATKLETEAAAIFQGIRWRPVGPEVQSGRVIDIDGPRDKPEVTLVAFATGGLWRTLDCGLSWEPIFEGQSAFSIGDFDVSHDGQTIWVGTGENNSQRTSYHGTGVFKSTDAGKTWKNAGLRDSHHIGQVLIDPKNEDLVWVGSIGPLYSDGGERGVYKTSDGGRTWQHVLPTGEDTGVIDLAMDPRNSNVVYAAAWERERRAWNFREGGEGTAIYKTTDGGKQWTKLTGFPAGKDGGRIGIAVAPSRPDTVYAFFDNQNPESNLQRMDERLGDAKLSLRRYLSASLEEIMKLERRELVSFLGRYLPRDEKAEDVAKELADGKLDKPGLTAKLLKRNPDLFELPLVNEEVWRSDDGGKTWTNASGRMGGFGGYYWDRLSVHPKDHNRVYVNALLLLESKDGGRTWEQINARSHVDHHVLWVDPRDPSKVWNGNDGGPYVSLDGGTNWRELNNLPVGQTTTVAVDNKVPYNIYTGLQDNGTLKGPSTYIPGRTPLERWVAIGGGDGSAIAVDPRNDGDIVFTASQFGSHSGQNQVTRERWNAAASAGQGEPQLRYNWISPIEISPHHPDIVYLGSQKVHRSFNGGRAYGDISPDLTRNIEQGDVPHSSHTTLSESPLKFGVIYAGADDGSIHVTKDGGVEWESVQTPLKTKWVSRIVASRYKPGRVYCTQTGYREDDFKPYVWVSEDYGTTWKSISANLPLEGVNVIREDPKVEEWLYVGTELGVYMSRNSGNDWTPLGGGLPRCAVHDLALQEKADDLVAATHGRSIWVMDLEWLRKLDKETEAKSLHAWTVSDVRLTDGDLFPRISEWASEYPDPKSVSVDLWSLPGGKAKVSLVKKGGETVKTGDWNLTPGLNFVSLGLALDPGNPLAPPSQVPPLNDPFAARRPKFPEAGDYVLVIEVAGEKIEAPFKISR
ncbi:MAG: WD40/YVTN/BNR-like repeat-containing protein [Fimbriimonadaceae bacterium]